MNALTLRVFSFIAPLSISAFATLAAQTVKSPAPPQPVLMPPSIAAPVDQPYARPVQLEVDLTNVTDRVAHVREQIPVQRNARELVLLYPQWIPGAHSPVGPISRIGGIVVTVDGRRVQWVRDQINVYAFHIPLGTTARTVELTFDYLSPIKPAEGRIEWSDAIVDLAWNEVAMYPAGFFSRDIPFDVTLKLPQAGNMPPRWRRHPRKGPW